MSLSEQDGTLGDRKKAFCSTTNTWTVTVAVIQILLSIGCFVIFHNNNNNNRRLDGFGGRPFHGGKTAEISAKNAMKSREERMREHPLAEFVLRGDGVTFPISSVTTVAFKITSVFDRNYSAMRRIASRNAFPISGFILGTFLLLANFLKSPRLLLGWLMVDGLRTLTIFLPPNYKSVHIEAFLLGHSRLEHLLITLIVILYQVIFFSVVFTHRRNLIDLRKRSQNSPHLLLQSQNQNAEAQHRTSNLHI